MRFFKNNYLFKERTNADVMLDFMERARDTITRFEGLYGEQVVEKFLLAGRLQSIGQLRLKSQNGFVQESRQWPK